MSEQELKELNEVEEVCDVCGSENTCLELLHNDGNCFNCDTKLN